MQMAAYLFELGYELALARKDDVSDSPGFESCGLIFDKTVSWLLNMLMKARKDNVSDSPGFEAEKLTTKV